MQSDDWKIDYNQNKQKLPQPAKDRLLTTMSQTAYQLPDLIFKAAGGFFTVISFVSGLNGIQMSLQADNAPMKIFGIVYCAISICISIFLFKFIVLKLGGYQNMRKKAIQEDTYEIVYQGVVEDKRKHTSSRSNGVGTGYYVKPEGYHEVKLLLPDQYDSMRLGSPVYIITIKKVEYAVLGE